MDPTYRGVCVTSITVCIFFPEDSSPADLALFSSLFFCYLFRQVQLIALSLTNVIVNIAVARFLFSAHFLKVLRSYTRCPGDSDFLSV